MEYVNLEKYAARMMELANGDHGLKPHRLASQRSRLAEEMHRILKPSFKRLTVRKKMTSDLYDEISQHAYIAIVRAMEDWNPTIATFSTHVHWKIRAELQTLQHVEFPERRKLSIPYRIHKMELDRPLRTEDGEGATMADFLVSEDGERGVEDQASEYMAARSLERAFSHCIARQMQAYCINQHDPEKIAERRHRLMRNRWIYIRRVIRLENYEAIAQEYNITRERSRQIIVAIDKEMKGMLPRYSKKDNKVIEATRIPPVEIHPCWEFMLADFHQATGIDSRLPDLIDNDKPLPPMRLDVEEYDFRPQIAVTSQTQDDMLAEIRRPVVEPETMVPTEGDSRGMEIATGSADGGEKKMDEKVTASNVVPLIRRPGPMRDVIKQVMISAAAGAMLSSAVAASAQSRAIPPEIEGTRPAELTVDPTVRAAQRNASPASGTSARPNQPQTSVIGEIGRITVRSPSWGIKVADFATSDAARRGVGAEQRNWGWLKDLRPAHIAPENEAGRHGLAFGPLTKEQARAMCHEAKRHERGCAVVEYGTTRTSGVKSAVIGKEGPGA